MSKTPPHNIRIPNNLWNAATTKATTRGETVSAAIRHLLEEYVKP